MPRKTSQPRKRPAVNPAPQPPLFTRGQPVRIDPGSDASLDARAFRGRVGIVVDWLVEPLCYVVAVYPGHRVRVKANDLRELDSSDHCAMPGKSNACQPRGDGRCVWCERACADGTVQP